MTLPEPVKNEVFEFPIQIPKPQDFKQSIKAKLIFLFILFTIVPVIVIGIFSFSVAARTLESQAQDVIESVANLKAIRLESFFKRIRGDIVIAQTLYNAKRLFPIIVRYADHRDNPRYFLAKAILDEQFKIWGKVRDEIVSAGFVNPQGRIVYIMGEVEPDSDSLLDQPLPDPGGKAFEQGKKGIYISELFESRRNPNHPLKMLVTLPVLGFKNEFVGVIFFEIDMTFIFEFIQDSTGLGDTGETYVVKNVGDGALFLNNLRHDPNSALKRKEIFGSSAALPAQEAVRGKNGAGISVDYRGKKVIAAWRYMPSMNWGLVTKVDADEVFEPVRQLKKAVLVIGFIILLAGMPILLLSLRSIFTKL